MDYKKLKKTYFEADGASLAIRKIGKGPALILVHGWPVFGYTWRFLLERLSEQFTCYIVDMPGLGDSKWKKDTDFNWRAQAKRLEAFVGYYDLKDYSIIANDSGGAISRLLAIEGKTSLKKLILINTEMPNHRPPWIPFYQKSSQLPFSRGIFRLLLKSNIFLGSSMGFGGFYSNKKLVGHPDYILPYVKPLINSSNRLEGAMSCLAGGDMRISDTFVDLHQKIEAKVLLIWGEDDPTFPIDLAKKMLHQFKDASLEIIPNASFVPHEEKPKEVLAVLLAFLAED